MRIAVLTSLYPSPRRPFEGIFAERRWLRMAGRGHEIEVMHPLPWTPPGAGWLLPGTWGEIAAAPRRELREAIAVRRPRYLHIPGKALGNAARFTRCALKHLAPAEVVVCDYAWPASNVAPILRQKGQPCVVSGRGSDVLQVAGEAGLAAELAANLRAAGTWCGVSGDLVEAMDGLAGEPRGRLVPNGVDLELFQISDRAEARAGLGLHADGPLVLVVGHLIERKDPLLALEAFLAGAPRGARLAFVGRGPLEAELAAGVAARGAGDRVQLVGEKQPAEIAQWLAASNLLLLTSHREGRPNVVLEALAAGRPVVATEAGGTREVLPEPRMLATSRNAAGIGEHISALLQDPPQPESLREFVEPLSWERSCEALELCLADASACREVAA